MAATLSALLAATVARRPDAVAVVDGATTLDWAAFARAVERCAGVMAARGVGPGARVALWLPNGAPYLIAIFAVARLGALAVHVNTRFGASEIGDLLARTQPVMLVMTDVVAGIDCHALLDTLSAPAGMTVLPAADIGDAVGGAGDVAAPEQDCLIFTTGGTTAKPKLVVHRQRSIHCAATTVAAAIGLDQEDAALLAAVPFCGTFGSNLAMAAVAGGATIVCQAVFDPGAAADLIRAHGITHAIGDDRMVARLAEAAGPGFDSLRFFGGAAFGADAAPAFSAGIGAGIPVRAIYGSSEVQSLYALGAGVGDGPVVPLHPDARFAVVDDELRLDGPTLFDRYLDDPAATEAAFADGLFRTGDRASNVGGAFVFEGRMGDVLRLGGFLVSPREIEAFLCAQPGVVEAQVVGIDGLRGTVPVGFVIAGDGFDEAEVIAAARAGLARYKVPARVVALDVFPTSSGPNGPKISRAELRVMAAGLDISS